MRVSYIKTAKSGRITVGVCEDGVSMNLSVPASLYASMSFVVGSELTDEELFALTAADEEYRAMKKALSLLSYSDKNRRELYRRLTLEGYSRAVAEGVVAACVGLGYINERDQLLRLVLRLANTDLRGPVYIRNKLRQKGYDGRDIDGVIAELVDCGEIDFEENLDRLIQKRGVTDEDEIRALAYKYGFRSL